MYWKEKRVSFTLHPSINRLQFSTLSAVFVPLWFLVEVEELFASVLRVVLFVVMRWGKEETWRAGTKSGGCYLPTFSLFCMLVGTARKTASQSLPSMQSLPEDTYNLFVPTFLRLCSQIAPEWCYFTFLHKVHSLWKSKTKEPTPSLLHGLYLMTDDHTQWSLLHKAGKEKKMKSV